MNDVPEGLLPPEPGPDAELRVANCGGLRWDLMLTREEEAWVVYAQAPFGEMPEPFRTDDEAEARHVFENFEKILAGEIDETP